MKKLTFLILVTFLWCGLAEALTRMGPPTATCEQGQFLIVPEFACSKNDVERDSGRQDKTVATTTLLARVGYGLEDDCELFVRGGTRGGNSWVPTGSVFGTHVDLKARYREFINECINK